MEVTFFQNEKAKMTIHLSINYYHSTGEAKWYACFVMVRWIQTRTKTFLRRLESELNAPHQMEIDVPLNVINIVY